MAAFAGLAAANSVTGLFLFCQWMYIAIGLFLRAFKNSGRKRAAGIPIVQQLVLRYGWLQFRLYIKNRFIIYKWFECRNRRNPCVNCRNGFCIGNCYRMPYPRQIYLGNLLFYAHTRFRNCCTHFVCYTPIAVLLKFSFLFTGLNNKILTLMIILEALLWSAALTTHAYPEKQCKSCKAF